MWSRWTRWASLGVALSNTGCETSLYDRAPYAVGSVAGVLYSNVLVVTAEEKPRKVGSDVVVSYPLLFQNESAEQAQLGLSSATVRVNGAQDRAIARCALHRRAAQSSVELPPGGKVRVDCQLQLTPRGLADARQSDSELTLAVPVLSAGRVLAPEFTFRLRLEDAS